MTDKLKAQRRALGTVSCSLLCSLTLLITGISSTGIAVAAPNNHEITNSVNTTIPVATEAQPLTNPYTTREWQEFNFATADYQRLRTLLAGEKPLTWLFLGDSITHGASFTQGLKRYSEYFADALATSPFLCHRRSADIVLNTGVSSAMTQNVNVNNDINPGLTGYYDSWFTDRKADIVFITFGMNDGRKPWVSLQDFTANIAKTAEDVRKSGGVPIIMTQNYTQTSSENPALNAYFNAERELAREKGIILLDFAQKWLESNQGNPIYDAWMTGGSDKIHPNREGHLNWAKFILQDLGLTDENRVLDLTRASVPKAGATLKLPGADAQTELPLNKQLAGGTGLTENQFTVQGKQFDSANTQKYSLSANPSLQAVSAATSANFTIRFRLDENASTNPEMILATLADKDSSKVLTASVFENKLRIGRDFGEGAGYDFYTLTNGPQINDGKFHTLSFNFSATQLQIFIDGKETYDLSLNTAASLAPNRFGFDTLTVGGAVAGHQPVKNGVATVNAKAYIDYVELFPSPLDASRIAAFKVPEAIAALEIADVAKPELKALYNPSKPYLWTFLGGTATAGILPEVAAKNYVQAFEEVLRWEYGNKPWPMRMKFVQNAALPNLNSAQLVQRYKAVVQAQKPAALTIAPDLLHRGELLETSVTEFKQNISELVRLAKAEGSVVSLITPAQIGQDIAPYVNALHEIAAAENLTIADAYAWLKTVADLNGADVLRANWFDQNGVMRANGHLELAKFFMESIRMLPSNKAASKIWALNYDGTALPTGNAPDFSLGKCEVPETGGDPGTASGDPDNPGDPDPAPEAGSKPGSEAGSDAGSDATQEPSGNNIAVLNGKAHSQNLSTQNTLAATGMQLNGFSLALLFALLGAGTLAPVLRKQLIRKNENRIN